MHVIIYYDVIDNLLDKNSSINFAMLSICNRSISFHMIEQILKMQEYSQHDQQSTVNIDKIIFISNDKPSLLRTYLGNGERWGCTIEVMPMLASLDYTIDVLAYSNNSKKMLIFTKLCIVNPQELYKSISNILSYEQYSSYKHQKTKDIEQNIFFISHALPFAPIHIPYVEIKNLEDIAVVTQNALNGEYPWLLREEKQSGDFSPAKRPKSTTEITNIFFGIQCSLAPSARIYPPSIIGHNVHVGDNCTIGPYACIGESCIIDENATIKNSIIFNNTYISPLVSITDAYVIGRNITQIGSQVCVIAPNALIEENKSDDVSLLSLHHDTKTFFLKNVLCSSLLWIVVLFVFLCISPIIVLQWILGKGSFARTTYLENDKEETLQCITRSKKIENTIYAAHKTVPSWLQGPIMTFFPSILNVISRDIPLFGSTFTKHECFQAMEWMKTKSPSMTFSNKKGLLPSWIGLSKAPLTSIEKCIHATWYAQASNACVDCKILLGTLRYGYGHIKEVRK